MQFQDKRSGVALECRKSREPRGQVQCPIDGAFRLERTGLRAPMETPSRWAKGLGRRPKLVWYITQITCSPSLSNPLKGFGPAVF